MDWVCDDAWRGPFTQTIFFLGSFFGSLFFGIVSDKLGRYPTFFVTNVMNLAFGIAISYCHDFASFTAVRFLSGLSYNTFFNTLYILGMTNSRCLRMKIHVLRMPPFLFQPWNMSLWSAGASLGMLAWLLATPLVAQLSLIF